MPPSVSRIKHKLKVTMIRFNILKWIFLINLSGLNGPSNKPDSNFPLTTLLRNSTEVKA